MIIPYLSQDAINDIKVNFSKYKKHFQDETNDWFINEFKKNGWLKDSKIHCDEINLNFDEDFNISDRRNVEILYSAMKNLSPAHASDERLWAGLLFGKLWKFVRYRRAAELASGDEQDIKNTFFFMRGTRRSCFVNFCSRLWWAGYLLCEPASEDHSAELDLVCGRAFASNMLLLSSSNMTSNRHVLHGALDCLLYRQTHGDTIERYHFVNSLKYLNSLGGVMLLDTLSRIEIAQLVNRQLNKDFGHIDLVIDLPVQIEENVTVESSSDQLQFAL